MPMKTPLQSGSIPYAKHIEKGDTVYSIDRFTFVFRFYPLQTDLYEKLLASLSQKDCFAVNQHMPIDRGKMVSSIYRVPVHWWQFGALHVELWNNPTTKKPIVQTDFQPMMRLDFNPNTMGDNEVFDAILGFLRNTDILYRWSMTRVDYAWDLPQDFSQTYVLSRKAFSTYGNSRYYGSRGSSGMLRVYDKTIEQAEKHHRDIGAQVTRCEWVQKHNRDFQFNFDAICKADWSSLTGGRRSLQFVSPECINAALAFYDRHTSAKIKKECFSAVPFDESCFHSLLSDYLTEFGFNLQFRQDYDAQFPSDDEHERTIESVLREFETKEE